MKTDICLITEGLSSFQQKGGVSTWTRELIRSLPDYHFSWINFSNQTTPPIIEQAISNLLSTLSVPITTYPLDLSELKKTIQGIDFPDSGLYHATSTGCASLLGMELSDKREVPFLLSEHAIYWKELAHTHELECGLRLPIDYSSSFREIARKAYRSAKIITSPVDYVRQFQLEEGADPKNCCVISNGCTPLPECKRKNPFCLGFVGRITRIKNLELWIAIAKEIHQQNSLIQFKIIGPIEDIHYARLLEEQILQSGLTSQITFLPAMDSQDWTTEIDGLLLTSLNESQPYVIIEAFSCGIPVFARAVGGIPETLGNAGYQFSSTDKPFQIATEIVAIIQDNQRTEDLSARAKDFFHQKYHILHMKKEFEQIYQRALRQNAKR